MTIRTGFGLALMAGSLVAGSVAVRPGPSTAGRLPTPPPEAASGEDPMEPLDRWIQKRMHEHEGAGVSRILDPFLDEHRFSPESPGEAAALAGLRRSGWEVGLYLGSRNLLAKGPAEDHDLSPPIAVGDEGPPAGLPGTEEIRAIGRRALAGAGSADTSRATLGRWSIFASVVRADRENCLTCHEVFNPAREGAGPARPRLGDPLGVAIYAYARDGRAAGKTPEAPRP